ncbi:cation diffusion facilitator family transporter [Brevundimonas alba]|uniref:Cation diffusion facilitator family transporter n=1 Tax=Brevundimonas alba TaxID=74314 RepID=A0A7X5YLR9_9CAUL|nr:cation diffusion facilitator family transporter [Brevundimonas alba]NJC40885.1 cation diffusion facilitator family transporter [Brevundimonas alba]
MAASTSKNVIFAALAGNTAIAVTKFGAALFTGSAAMMSEAIHSTVDTGNQIILLIGLKRAARPASETHPFGHGLQLYFYTFVVAVLIFGVGAVVSILHGVERIRSPEAIDNPWVNYIILGLSICFEGASWFVAFKAFNQERAGRPILHTIRSSKDPTVFTVLFEDTAALAGLVVAFVGVVASHLLNLPLLDGVASVIIGLILAVTAGFLAFESQSLLTGEAADPDTRHGIEAIAREEPGVDGLNDARTMHFGPNEILVALSLDFRNDLTAADVEDTVARLEHRLRAAFPQIGRIYVEAQSFASHAAVRQAVIAGGGAGALVSDVPVPPRQTP